MHSHVNLVCVSNALFHRWFSVTHHMFLFHCGITWLKSGICHEVPNSLQPDIGIQVLLNVLCTFLYSQREFLQQWRASFGLEPFLYSNDPIIWFMVMLLVEMRFLSLLEIKGFNRILAVVFSLSFFYVTSWILFPRKCLMHSFADIEMRMSVLCIWSF